MLEVLDSEWSNPCHLLSCIIGAVETLAINIVYEWRVFQQREREVRKSLLWLIPIFQLAQPSGRHPRWDSRQSSKA